MSPHMSLLSNFNPLSYLENPIHDANSPINKDNLFLCHLYILTTLWLSLQFASLISLVVFACKLNNLPQIGWCNNSQIFFVNI